MSLVNQMLQDLEHRRTGEASVSPLGGLSASGVAVASTQSINYLLLGVTLVSVVSVVFVLIYLFALKQPLVEPIAENVNVLTAETSPVMANAELLAKPKLYQSVMDEEPLLLEAKPIENKARPVEPAKSKSEKTESLKAELLKTESLKITAINDLKKDESSISISKPSAKNEKAALAIVPTNVDGVQPSHRSVSKTVRPLTREQQAQMAFQSAVKFLGRGDELAARKDLEKALSIEPVHLRAREALSALLLNTGHVTEAVESLREGLRLRPTATPLAKLYAHVLVDRGDNDAAVAILEKARPVVATDPDYYALLAVLYRGAGKHAQASQTYQQILQVRPGVAAWWMGLALAEDAMGSSAQALEAYQRAHRAGGLKTEVLQYMQSRIAALKPIASEKPSQATLDDNDGFED